MAVQHFDNQWHSYLRKKKTHYELDEQLPSNETGPIENTEQTEIVNQVRRVVATLPITERQVLVLVDLDELPYCDVAEILEIPIGTVMSRLHRARKHLLKKMEQATTAVPGKEHIQLVK